MTKRSIFEIILGVAIPIAGAMGYVHGNFVTITELNHTQETTRF